MAPQTANGLYAFRFDAELEMESEWKLVLPRADEQKLEVTKCKGEGFNRLMAPRRGVCSSG